MAECKIKKPDLSKLVCAEIQEFFDPPVKITPGKRFWDDLRVDRESRRQYHEPINKAMKKKGCNIDDLPPATFMDCVAVKDVVELVHKNCAC